MVFLLLRVCSKHMEDYSIAFFPGIARVLAFTPNTETMTGSSTANMNGSSQSSSEQNDLLEGALPTPAWVSNHNTSSVQGSITLSGTSAF